MAGLEGLKFVVQQVQDDQRSFRLRWLSTDCVDRLRQKGGMEEQALIPVEVAAVPVANLPKYRLNVFVVGCLGSLLDQIGQNKMSQLE